MKQIAARMKHRKAFPIDQILRKVLQSTHALSQPECVGGVLLDQKSP